MRDEEAVAKAAGDQCQGEKRRQKDAHGPSASSNLWQECLVQSGSLLGQNPAVQDPTAYHDLSGDVFDPPDGLNPMINIPPTPTPTPTAAADVHVANRPPAAAAAAAAVPTC